MSISGRKAAQRGKGFDLADLSSAYDAPLKRYFLRRGALVDDADDMVQEVYARLIAMNGESRIDNPRAYLFRIASNLMTDMYRRRARQSSGPDESYDEDIHRVQGEGFSPERVVIGRNELDRLKQVILALPQKPRDVFMLHRFEGLKYREIGVALGMSVSAVEKHMMAALAGVARGFKR